MGHPFLIKEAIGRFEFRPIREGLRQRASRMSRQIFCDVHQTLITALIAQLRKSKFVLGPLGWSKECGRHAASMTVRYNGTSL